MKELLEHKNGESLNLSLVDTYVFDYGGVVAFHYCEPWQGNLSRLLNTSPEKVRSLLSESGELGRNYRLGKMSRDEFWNLVIKETRAEGINPSELELNWAMSYQIDNRMMSLIARLRSERGAKIGLLSNSDAYRQNHNEKMYGLSQKFDFMISSHTHQVVKPEKVAYEKMLQIANNVSSANKVLYIDDREKNVIPGLQIGIQGYVFSSYENFVNLLNDKGILNF